METQLSLGISLLILIALIFLAWPLLRQQNSGLKKTWLATFLVLPMVVMGAYWSLGSPIHLLMVKPQVQTPETSLVEKLEARLKKNDDSIHDWMLLARSHFTLKNYPQAENAFRKVLTQQPDNVAALLGLADCLGMQNNGILFGKPQKFIEQALVLEPLNPLALQLAAALEMQQGNKTQAKLYLDQIKTLLNSPPKTDWHHAANTLRPSNIRAWLNKITLGRINFFCCYIKFIIVNIPENLRLDKVYQ